MAEVSRLPGLGCRHHIGGRCLYQEHLNPGYSTEWRCQVLAHWEDEYDEFLHRVEAMNVAQDAVPDLWGRKFERLARQKFQCDRYVFGAGCGAPSCIHVHEGLCRLSLPECKGRCRHFAREENESDI